MKKLAEIIFYFYSTLVISQVQPGVTYDPETGNYIIEYEEDNEEPVLVRRNNLFNFLW